MSDNEIVFHINSDKLSQQIALATMNLHIELATKKLCNPEFDAVVTISKLSEKSRKSFYGFHFEKHGAVKQGDIQRLEDGSVRRIEKVIVHIKNQKR
jgi:hypothetical protein